MGPRSEVWAGLAALALGLAGCGGSGRPDDQTAGAPPPPATEIASAATALSGADLPMVDPHTMDDAEIRAVVGAGPRCEFRYTSDGKPVLALQAGGEAGVVMLNGRLVPLRQDSAGVGVAEGVRLQVGLRDPADAEAAAASRRVGADLLFEAGDRLKVGYTGYYSCSGSRGGPAPPGRS